MNRNKMGIRIFLLIMMVGIVLIPAVSAQQENNSSEDERYLPDFGQSIYEELKNNSDVFEIRGAMPEIKDDNKKLERLDILEKSIRSSKEELEPYMKENGGPLIGFGVNYEGYIFVEFDEELIDTIDKSTINKLYTIIDDDAKKVNLSDTPVVFKKGKEPTLGSRTSLWTNMYGGIGLSAGGYSSTLAFAAVDSSGTEGFVMSGHAAVAAGGIGADVYQGGRKVGDVGLYNGVFADAAWVEASNVVDDVYYTTDTNQKDVTGDGDPGYGSTVYKSGITTGLTSGTVTTRYIEVSSSTFGRLYEQFVASYSSSGGDSGSPVFTMTASGVKIAGINWAYLNDTSYFSPISGVESDLGVEPIN